MLYSSTESYIYMHSTYALEHNLLTTSHSLPLLTTPYHSTSRHTPITPYHSLYRFDYRYLWNMLHVGRFIQSCQGRGHYGKTTRKRRKKREQKEKGEREGKRGAAVGAVRAVR